MYDLNVKADVGSLHRADDSALLESGGVAAALGADVIVRSSGARGGTRGLFARRAFSAGERIIIERAFIWERRVGAGEVWTPASMLPDDVDAALLQLAPRAATRANPGDALTTLRHSLLSAALASNAFGVGAAAAGSAAGAAGQGGSGRALFSLISMANHNCEANCRTRQVEEGEVDTDVDTDVDIDAPPARVLEARRDIDIGEELCIGYVPATWARTVRATRLTQLWGFACVCARCSAPGDDTIVLRCSACPDGRVFGGSTICVDCGAKNEEECSSSNAATATAANTDNDLEALTAPGTARQLVTRLVSHPRLAMEDVRVWLTACELLNSLTKYPALERELRSAARAAALRMRYVVASEWDVLDEEELD